MFCLDIQIAHRSSDEVCSNEKTLFVRCLEFVNNMLSV